MYGAYGYTGRLIIEEALKNKETPVLAGRNLQKLIPLANEVGLDYIVFNLEKPEIIKEKIKKYETVFNAAGPFQYTSKPLVQACLKTSVNYLDITGEIGVFKQNFALNNEAIKKEIAIISGVGFDVVPTDCMALYVSNQIQEPNNLELGISGMSGMSPGTLKTMIDKLEYGAILRRNGEFISKPLGGVPKRIRFIDKERLCYAISWGDLCTAYRTTGIPNITTYMSLPKFIRYLTGPVDFFARSLLGLRSIKKIAKFIIDKQVQGPNEYARNNYKSYIWAKVRNKKGESFESWLQTLEAYHLTAISAIRCIQKLRKDQSHIKGALTPSLAFGSDFILEFPQTIRMDSL
ncbi:MAG: saccharopine dehydrogenase NADP-binding domain-containing protein [Candidatus Lokiarchaeota archaeon]